MSKCSIDISFDDSVEGLIKKVKDKITSDKDGEFDGDSEKGKYSIPTPGGGKVKGTYKVKEKSIHLKITDKPMLVGCDKIEDKIKKYLSTESD